MRQQKSKIILDTAMQYIAGVPYKTTTRNVFYVVWQSGCFAFDDQSLSEGNKKKLAYTRFKGLTSRARHAFEDGWKPDTLTDDTRRSLADNGDYLDAREYFRSMARNAVARLDVWPEQPQYVEAWFEAEAMLSQFEYYVPRQVTLRPLKGDPSIHYKWQIAQDLKERFKKYEKEIVILYFGDYDKKGLQIPESAIRDIREWCGVPFRFERCGLSLEDVEKYNVPDNPEKPGQYQWEALTDTGAKEIISSNISRFIDHEAITRVEDQEEEATTLLKEALQEVANKHYG